MTLCILFNSQYRLYIKLIFKHSDTFFEFILKMCFLRIFFSIQGIDDRRRINAVSSVRGARRLPYW